MNRAERSHDPSPLIFVQDGTIIALDPADGGVRVQTDNQAVALAPRPFEQPDVPDMDQVKATIGKDNPASLRPFAPDNPRDFFTAFYFFQAQNNQEKIKSKTLKGKNSAFHLRMENIWFPTAPRQGNSCQFESST